MVIKNPLTVSKKLLIAVGGSGGHLFPAQQLAEMLQRKGECEILFAGYKLEKSPFFNREKASFVEIPASPFGKLKFIFTLFLGFCKSFRLIRAFQPDIVVGFGSYHAFSILLASVILKKKIILFEANSILGKVNRFFSRFSRSLAVQFPIEKGVLVPFLPWICHQEKWDKKEAKISYRLDGDTFTYLVFGGSQGARFLNESIPYALARLGGKKQVIHLTGEKSDSLESTYQKLGILASVKPFEPNMAMAYAAADCVICRSGAGTIADLISYQIPALLIPFPKASQDHQRKNGEYLLKYQAARLLLEKEANLERLVFEIESLVSELGAKKLALEKLYLQTVNRTDFADLVLGRTVHFILDTV